FGLVSVSLRQPIRYLPSLHDALPILSTSTLRGKSPFRPGSQRRPLWAWLRSRSSNGYSRRTRKGAGSDRQYGVSLWPGRGTWWAGLRAGRFPGRPGRGRGTCEAGRGRGRARGRGGPGGRRRARPGSRGRPGRGHAKGIGGRGRARVRAGAGPVLSHAGLSLDGRRHRGRGYIDFGAQAGGAENVFRPALNFEGATTWQEENNPIRPRRIWTVKTTTRARKPASTTSGPSR